MRIILYSSADSTTQRVSVVLPAETSPIAFIFPLRISKMTILGKQEDTKPLFATTDPPAAPKSHRELQNRRGPAKLTHEGRDSPKPRSSRRCL